MPIVYCNVVSNAWRWILSLFAGLVLGAGPVLAGPVALTPHRAVYELSLDKSRSSGTVSQASGKLEFEWVDVCTGWTVSQRTRVQMVSADGEVLDFGWTLNALEAKDGQDYRFFIRRINSGAPAEELRGEAHLEGPGRGGTAIYSDPEPREVNLPEGTMFPTAHSLLLIETAEQGGMPLWRVVFDGSGEDGLFGINAVLSQELEPGVKLRHDSPALEGQKSWRLHLAYFTTDETVSVPEHEQTIRLFANGIVDEMRLDYGDFTLKGDLRAVEALPAPQC